MIRPITGYSSIKDRKVELFLNQSESLLSDDSTSSLPIFLGADLNQRPAFAFDVFLTQTHTG